MAPNRTPYWQSSLAVCHRKQIRLVGRSIAKVTDPANRIVATEDVAIISFNDHQRCTLVVTFLMESFRSVEL